MAQISGENEIMDDDDTGISYALDMFREFDAVNDMITEIPNVSKEFVSSERGFENLKTILDQYQEQPHLLDPHLENLLSPLLAIIRNPSLPDEALCLAFQYLWLIVKVRGYKTVMKKMPHEVKDLTPVLTLLEREGLQKEFYGSYILLMWLSIIIYMPFNLTGFDTSVSKTMDSKQSVTVVERILIIIKKHLKTPQSSREMAAFLVSRFVTRPDLREKCLPEYIDFCFEILEESDPKEPFTLFNKMGVLRALGLIFKHGKREELLPYAPNVLVRFLKSQVPFSQDTPLQKLSMKLVQRLGLTFVRPKVASWRYQRGSRSLALNVQKLANEIIVRNSTDGNPEHEDDNDVPNEIEDVIDYLLQGLKDKDTVVRWSAAKGIGRVTGRLPRSLADDVVGAILEQFSTRDSDKAWHGGCLALAELARRGLLLPERLPEVLPVLEKALVFDELRGQYSVGANIRDAACYMCWAFARAYNPDQLTNFVQQLATGLLIVSLFDREIPCRRAGSAAFQEHVGRQGNFPRGIEILTAVDYFAVGNRSKAYLNLSVFVGKYEEYTQSLIDHLVDKKVGHWDSVIRELTAKALHNLTCLSPTYVSQNVLSSLLNNSTGPVLIMRHGSLLSAGYIIHALAVKANEEGKLLECYIDQKILEKVYSVISILDTNMLFRGMGGQFMRQAAAVFIEKCSQAKIPMEGHRDVLDQWHNLLEECVLRFEENIRQYSLQALEVMWSQYYRMDTPEMILWRDNLIDRYVAGLKSDRESYSLGYTSALGRLTRFLVAGKFDLILSSLLDVMKITPLTAKWAEGRREAINSIIRLSKEVGVTPIGNEKDCVCNSNANKILSALLNCLDDYTMDRRGDIGAWVREASMQALQTLTTDILENKLEVLDDEVVNDLLPRICQQSVERIDRTRKVGGITFSSLLYSSPKLKNIPNNEELEEIFPFEWCNSCNWASESTTYKKFVELLDFPIYRHRVLLGIIYSLGGVSANLSRYTQEALQNYLNDRMEKKEFLLDFCDALLNMFEKYQKDDRILLPLMKGLYNLLSSCSALDQLLETETSLIPRLLTNLKKVCYKCSDYHKLSATVMILCELLRIETTSTTAILTQLSIFLGFQYPKVRAITATSFLTALQDYSDREIILEENVDEVTSILEDTPWMDSMELAREKRNKVCQLMGISMPQAKKP